MLIEWQGTRHLHFSCDRIFGPEEPRSTYADYCLLSSLLAVGVGEAKGDAPHPKGEYELLRSFAKNELGGKHVRFTNPMQQIVGKDTLLFDFGSVSVLADTAIALQLRVELLRKKPLLTRPTKRTNTNQPAKSAGTALTY